MTTLINGLIAALLAMLIAATFAGGVQMQCGLNLQGGKTCIWSLIVKQPPTL